MKTFKINNNDAGQRLDKFVSKITKDMPKPLLNKMIRKKRIKINGKRCENKSILNYGDILELYINDEFFKSESTHEKKRVQIQFKPVYEDENILIVDKPVGLRCHSDQSKAQNTLIEQVKQYLQDKGDYNSKQELSFSPALCNRLDRNTQGLVIAAKNAASLRMINEKIKNREIEKRYICAVSGTPDPNKSVLTGYLTKDTKRNKAIISSAQTPESKEIITGYEVIRSNDNFSLVEIILHTGRFHQIRAHMASIGHPIMGDKKYGGVPMHPYQLLCAHKILFNFKTNSGDFEYLNKKEINLNGVWFENMI